MYKGSGSLRALVIVATLMVAMLTACAHHNSIGSPAPSGRAVAGRVVAQSRDGSNRVPAGGLRIGAYTTAVAPGPVLQNPPRPIATTTTSKQGRFELRGLEPGRYFITATNDTAVQGRWVTVTATRGASVVLLLCKDCPVALVGGSQGTGSPAPWYELRE